VRVNIKPQVDKWVFPDGHAVIHPGRGATFEPRMRTGHPSFVMSNSFTNQVMATDRAVHQAQGLRAQGLRVAQVPSTRRWPAWHLEALGVHLTTLTKKQAEYIGVPIDGPTSPMPTGTEPPKRQ